MKSGFVDLSSINIVDGFASEGFPANCGGGVFVHAGASITLSKITVANNRATFGGGICTDGALFVHDSTISGNSALSLGGGVLIGSGEVALSNVTVADNDALSSGGGLYVEFGTMLAINNTIIAANITLGEGPDIHNMFSVPISTVGGNLISDLGLSGLSPSATVLVDSPLLGVLADNGGPTLTMLPQSGSPAIDATTPVDLSVFVSDQRGLPRIVNGMLDIGAVEVQPTISDEENYGQWLRDHFSQTD